MAFDEGRPPLGATGTGAGGVGSAGMAERIRRILLQPRLEWPVIDAEPMTVKGIMMGWAVPLAAIGPVAQFVGAQLFGYGALGLVYRPPLVASLVGAGVSYAMALLSVWVLSLIIDALAPTFGGVKSPVAAMKVAAFASTAAWLAGAFQIVPMLGFLAILGLYSLYLLYLGLPRLMRAPEGGALGYTVATCVAAAVLFVIVGGVTSAVAYRATAPILTGDAAPVDGGRLAALVPAR